MKISSNPYEKEKEAERICNLVTSVYPLGGRYDSGGNKTFGWGDRVLEISYINIKPKGRIPIIPGYRITVRVIGHSTVYLYYFNIKLEEIKNLSAEERNSLKEKRKKSLENLILKEVGELREKGYPLSKDSPIPPKSSEEIEVYL